MKDRMTQEEYEIAKLFKCKTNSEKDELMAFVNQKLNKTLEALK